MGTTEREYKLELENKRLRRKVACLCSQQGTGSSFTVNTASAGFFVGTLDRYAYDSFDSGTSSTAANATGESTSGIGNVLLEGTGPKTISAAGGGKIYWANSGATFATAPSTFRVGIQPVSTTTGVETGTFSVYGELLAGTDTIANVSVISTTMTSGSITLNNGDLIAVVAEMTTRAGADSVFITRWGGSSEFPYTATDTGGGPSKNDDRPMFFIVFDDGTVGTLNGTGVGFPRTFSPATFNSTTTPDEYALVFTAPITSDVSMVSMSYSSTGNDSDPELVIYSDPTGTPVEIHSQVLKTDVNSFQAGSSYTVALDSSVSFVQGTQYAISIRATTAVNLTLQHLEFGTGNEILRKAYMLGDSAYMGSRTNATGAFTLDGTRLPLMGYFIK